MTKKKNKKPDKDKHSDIRVPDEDIKRDSDSPSFNESLRKVSKLKRKEKED